MSGRTRATRCGWVFLAVCVTATCWLAAAQRGAAAEAPGVQDATPAKKLDAVSYCEICDLRTKLCLTNDVLGAMGLTEGEAKAVLFALVTWHGERKADREDVDARKRRAEKDLREAEQKVHMGPRDEALLARIPGLRSEHEAAQKAGSDLDEMAATEVSKLLSQSQIDVWQTVRASKLPEPYRYAPNVTPEQEKGLMRAAQGATGCSDEAKTPGEAAKQFAEMKEAREKVFTSSQLESVKQAMENKRKCMMGIFKAAEEVLPMPDELRPHPIAAGTVPPPVKREAAKN